MNHEYPNTLPDYQGATKDVPKMVEALEQVGFQCFVYEDLCPELGEDALPEVVTWRVWKARGFFFYLRGQESTEWAGSGCTRINVWEIEKAFSAEKTCLGLAPKVFCWATGSLSDKLIGAPKPQDMRVQTVKRSLSSGLLSQHFSNRQQ